MGHNKAMALNIIPFYPRPHPTNVSFEKRLEFKPDSEGMDPQKEEREKSHIFDQALAHDHIMVRLKALERERKKDLNCLY